MANQVLKISNVSKSYGDHLAVNDLSLEAKPGSVIGLLGPNGAGKTTTISMITGLIKPDSGSIDIFNSGSPEETQSRQNIGVAPQSLALYEPLSAYDNLSFFGKIYGLRGSALDTAIDDALALADLADRKDEPVNNFSGGMKRRLNLAIAMINKPKLLLLDEPTVGVDPQSRNALLDSVVALRDQGHTIIYTTHYMEEAQKVCDSVFIMDRGKILAAGTIGELVHKYGGEYAIHIQRQEAVEIIESSNPLVTLNELNIDPDSAFIQVRPPDLEQVFFNLTGKQLRD